MGWFLSFTCRVSPVRIHIFLYMLISHYCNVPITEYIVIGALFIEESVLENFAMWNKIEQTEQLPLEETLKKGCFYTYYNSDGFQVQPHSALLNTTPWA